MGLFQDRDEQMRKFDMDDCHDTTWRESGAGPLTKTVPGIRIAAARWVNDTVEMAALEAYAFSEPALLPR